MRWRLSERHAKFAREVGSVVLGVLIALAGAEIVEALRWRARAASADTAIRGELAVFLTVAQERVLVQPCIDARLRDLRTILVGAVRTGRLPDIGDVSYPPDRTMSRAAWDVATGSGVPLHWPRERAARLATIYTSMDRFRASTDLDTALWAQLRVLEGMPGATPAEPIWDSLKTLGQLRDQTDLTTIIARQQLRGMTALGIVPDYREIANDTSQERLIALVRTRGICRPLMVDGKPYRRQPA